MAYFFITVLSFYTNTLLARFHMLNGRRNIRFRDLARSGFGASQVVAPFFVSFGGCEIRLAESQQCLLWKPGALLLKEPVLLRLPAMQSSTAGQQHLLHVKISTCPHVCAASTSSARGMASCALAEHNLSLRAVVFHCSSACMHANGGGCCFACRCALHLLAGALPAWEWLAAACFGQAKLQTLKSCAGTPGFWGVWVLQWLNLLAANVGLFIFAGQSLKVHLQPSPQTAALDAGT